MFLLPSAFYVGDYVEMGYSTGYLDNWDVGAGAERQNVRYIIAQSAEQVGRAIKEFRAKAKNNPTIIVKNTGHDYLGRGMISNADVDKDVLIVWTHRLQSKRYFGDASSGAGRDVKLKHEWATRILTAAERADKLTGMFPLLPCPQPHASRSFTTAPVPHHIPPLPCS